MKNVLKVSVIAALFAFQGTARGGIEDLVISEFMAINDSVLQDQDGEFADWAEIYNAGATAVNIGGCFMTDDPLERDKWRFPSVTLEANAFLVVFCSDKDRRNPGAELHTNFRLRGSGEYLALVAPDGETVLWEYAPTFPEQVPNFSYGLAMNASFFQLVQDRAPARTRIPTSGDAGIATSLAWTEVGFNDNGWTAGQTGVGYDNSSDYDSLIRTDVDAQMDGVNTSAWIRIPFSVSDPSELNALLLRMKYDDGFIAYLNGTRVAAANAPDSPAPWDAAATEDHTDSEAVVFVEYSVPGGLLREGTNILAIHGLNRGTSSSDFLIVPELDAGGSGTLDRDSRGYFHIPTPGSGNVPGFPGVSPKPSFSIPSIVFRGSLSLQLGADSPNAVVRYTLNGSDPTENSTVYDGPITLTSSTVVRARSFAPGFSPSPIVTETYLTVDSTLQNRTSNVPMVIVDTFNRSIPGTGSTTFGPAFMAIFDVKEDGRSSLSNVPDIVSRIGIKERGSSTGGRPKNSYRFEFWDDQDEDKDVEPLGLPRDSDWILYGAYNFDHTHMRNPFIYELSRHVGRYAARTRFTEVFLNENGGTLTSGDYWGVYSFMESVKRSNARVDIERLDPSVTTDPEIRGGYILKKDRGDPGGSGSFSAGGVDSIQFSYPDVVNTNSTQRNWIRNHLNTVFSTADFWNYIDPLAAIDHHILNAMPKNVDAFRLSGYFFKPRWGPVEFGPIWDFDRSMESTDGRDDAYNTWAGTGDSSKYFAYDSRTPYWSRWLQQTDFRQLWIDRWFELRRGPMSTGNIFSILQRMTDDLREAAPRDMAKWRQTSNWLGDVSHLRDWLTNRVNWIDSQWLRPPTFNRAGGSITPGVELRISGVGSIYYTLDGSDPRRAGGGIAPDATLYDSPIVLEENSRVVARIRANSNNWSAPTAATYVVTTPPVVISEIMFHPPNPDPDSPYLPDDFEYVELVNVGNEPVDLTGAAFTDAIEYTFTTFVGGGDAVLLPGERVVVVRNLEAFRARYDTRGILIAGEYEDNFSNAGEIVGFVGPLREPIHLFAFSDLWYPTTDGGGDSLTIVDPYSPLGTWDEDESWAPSSILGGTPGTDDSGLGRLGRQLPGDSNQDGILDISDSISLLRRLFVGEAGPLPCEGDRISDGGNLLVFDVNGDEVADISDVLYTLSFLFMEGPPPVLGTSCVRLEGCQSVCRF